MIAAVFDLIECTKIPVTWSVSPIPHDTVFGHACHRRRRPWVALAWALRRSALTCLLRGERRLDSMMLCNAHSLAPRPLVWHTIHTMLEAEFASTVTTVVPVAHGLLACWHMLPVGRQDQWTMRCTAVHPSCWFLPCQNACSGCSPRLPRRRQAFGSLPEAPCFASLLPMLPQRSRTNCQIIGGSLSCITLPGCCVAEVPLRVTWLLLDRRHS